MERLFGYVWVLILASIYIYLWMKVLSNIKTLRNYYKPMEIFRHLETFSKWWIIVHVAIVFLWSLSEWEG